MKRQLEEVNVVIENAMIQLHYCISTPKYFKLASNKEAKIQLNHMLKKYFFAANMGEQRLEQAVRRQYQVKLEDKTKAKSSVRIMKGSVIYMYKKEFYLQISQLDSRKYMRGRFWFRIREWNHHTPNRSKALSIHPPFCSKAPRRGSKAGTPDLLLHGQSQPRIQLPGMKKLSAPSPFPHATPKLALRGCHCHTPLKNLLLTFV